MYTIQDGNPKEKKSDRILVLKPIGGKASASNGLVDPRLFKGENKLHAVMDPQNAIWSFRYESGGLPEPLKQSFTSFKNAKQHAENYFRTRNIEITEVID